MTKVEIILEGIKLARGLYESGVLEAGKAVLDSVIDGVESGESPEDLRARVKAATDTLAADDAAVDARLKRLELARMNDDTEPGIKPKV